MPDENQIKRKEKKMYFLKDETVIKDGQKLIMARENKDVSIHYCWPF